MEAKSNMNIPVQTQFTARVQEKKEFVIRSCSKLNSGLSFTVTSDRV